MTRLSVQWRVSVLLLSLLSGFVFVGPLLAAVLIPVRWIDQVLDVALAHQPTPLPKSPAAAPEEPKDKVKEKKSSRVRAH